jgi:hypothetical protein
VTVRSGRARVEGEATGAVKRTLVDYAQRLDVIPALRAHYLLAAVAQRAAEANKGSRGSWAPGAGYLGERKGDGAV